MKFRLVVVALAAMALGAVGGCGKGGPKLVKIAGTVKFRDGSLIPVPEKGKGSPPKINFMPIGEAAPGQVHKGASSAIDASGHFELMTIKPGDGVAPGKYSASIYAPKTDPPDGKSLVAEKYTKPKTSGLEFTFDAPNSNLEILLDKE